MMLCHQFYMRQSMQRRIGRWCFVEYLINPHWLQAEAGT
ncbi:hypothetical protein ES288_D07G132900v1 [Gossypium darwinii]|uniref:Uncharacterized protein n=1 Tax=Gossypium darwinii TaxID=34276 RepID=A0A5D2BYR5_GOSDA|nr:hypothetical protein ES288_D07G132900v1 [Gossypium darwinii]